MKPVKRTFLIVDFRRVLEGNLCVCFTVSEKVLDCLVTELLVHALNNEVREQIQKRLVYKIITVVKLHKHIEHLFCVQNVALLQGQVLLVRFCKCLLKLCRVKGLRPVRL